MVGRLFGIAIFSLFIGFIVATGGLLVFPDLAVVAGPLLCDGALVPSNDLDSRFRFVCEQAGTGQRSAVLPLRVIGASTLVYALFFSPLAALLFLQRNRALGLRNAEIANDRARAVQARADVLAWPSGHAVLRRLTRQAEVRMVLWVQAPNMRPYEAQVTWLVDDEQLARAHPGTTLTVCVNLLHPERVYPAEDWGELIF
jgi:hypothetical protein